VQEVYTESSSVKFILVHISSIKANPTPRYHPVLGC